MLIDEATERAMGESTLEAMGIAHAALPDSDARVRAVRAVGQRIADAVEALLDEVDAAKHAKEATAALAAVRAADSGLLHQHPHAGAPPALTPAAPQFRPKGVLRQVYRLLGWEVPARWQWRILVVDKDTVNAFCLPGGTVVVFTGLLDFIDAGVRAGRMTDRESALATVMAHEVAHAVARHGAERAAASAPLEAWLAWLRESSPLLPVLAALLHSNPYSRLLEHEADEIGLHLMARACYDTALAPQFFEAMQSEPGRGTHALLAWLSTHPADAERAGRLAGLSARLAPAQQGAAGCCPDGLRSDACVERALRTPSRDVPAVAAAASAAGGGISTWLRSWAGQR